LLKFKLGLAGLGVRFNDSFEVVDAAARFMNASMPRRW